MGECIEAGGAGGSDVLRGDAGSNEWELELDKGWCWAPGRTGGRCSLAQLVGRLDELDGTRCSWSTIVLPFDGAMEGVPLKFRSERLVSDR